LLKVSETALNVNMVSMESWLLYQNLWYSKAPTISDEELTQEGLTIIDQEHLRIRRGKVSLSSTALIFTSAIRFRWRLPRRNFKEFSSWLRATVYRW
jgi:hypothetical protein